MPKGWEPISVKEPTKKLFDALRKNVTADQFLKKLLHLYQNPPEPKVIHKQQPVQDQLPDLSCVYASWNNPQQRLVDCARLLSRKGKVITMRYEACVKCFGRRTFVKKRAEEQRKPEAPKPEEEAKPRPRQPKPSMEEIVNQIGVCLNPLKISQTRPLTCVLCKKTYYPKWKACQEIQEEIRTQPMTRKWFFDSMTQRG